MDNRNLLQLLKSKPNLFRIPDGKFFRQAILGAPQAAIKIPSFTEFTHNEAERASIEDIV